MSQTDQAIERSDNGLTEPRTTKKYKQNKTTILTFEVAQDCFLNCREVIVKKQKYIVPRYINRVDIFLENDKGTHGWQLRYKKLSIFYNDKKQSSVRMGLERAKSDLKKGYIIKQHLKVEHYSKLTNKANQSKKRIKLIPGVHFGSSITVKKPFKQYYIHCSIPIFNNMPRRFSKYISTKNQLTDEKIKNAVQLMVTLKKYADYLYTSQETELAKVLTYHHITPQIIERFCPRIKYPKVKQVTKNY